MTNSKAFSTRLALVAVACSAAFLVGCGQKPPGCAAPETTSLMRELVVSDIGKDLNADLAKGAEGPSPSAIINHLTVNAGMRDWSPVTLSKVGQEVSRYLQGIKVDVAEIVSNGYDDKASKNSCAGKITVTTLTGKQVVINSPFDTQRMVDDKTKFLLHVENYSAVRKPIFSDLLEFLAAAKIGTDPTPPTAPAIAAAGTSEAPARAGIAVLAAGKVKYAKDGGSISVDQAGDKVHFDLSSAVGDHACSLEGVASVKTASHAVYVSDDKGDKCTASLTFSGDRLKVETAECSSSCGMRAEGSMDGEYHRSASGK